MAILTRNFYSDSDTLETKDKEKFHNASVQNAEVKSVSRARSRHIRVNTVLTFLHEFAIRHQPNISHIYRCHFFTKCRSDSEQRRSNQKKKIFNNPESLKAKALAL